MLRRSSDIGRYAGLIVVDVRFGLGVSASVLNFDGRRHADDSISEAGIADNGFLDGRAGTEIVVVLFGYKPETVVREGDFARTASVAELVRNTPLSDRECDGGAGARRCSAVVASIDGLEQSA